MGQMRLAIFAQVAAVGVDYGGGVIVEAGLILLIHWDDQHHPGLRGQLLHARGGRAVGDALGHAVPVGVLHLAEIGPVEKLLETEDLHALFSGLAGVHLVLLDHGLLVTAP